MPLVVVPYATVLGLPRSASQTRPGVAEGTKKKSPPKETPRKKSPARKAAAKKIWDKGRKATFDIAEKMHNGFRAMGYDTGDTPANTYLKNIGIQFIIQNIMQLRKNKLAPPPLIQACASAGIALVLLVGAALPRLLAVGPPDRTE